MKMYSYGDFGAFDQDNPQGEDEGKAAADEQRSSRADRTATAELPEIYSFQSTDAEDLMPIDHFADQSGSSQIYPYQPFPYDHRYPQQHSTGWRNEEDPLSNRRMPTLQQEEEAMYAPGEHRAPTDAAFVSHSDPYSYTPQETYYPPPYPYQASDVTPTTSAMMPFAGTAEGHHHHHHHVGSDVITDPSTRDLFQPPNAFQKRADNPFEPTPIAANVGRILEPKNAPVHAHGDPSQDSATGGGYPRMDHHQEGERGHPHGRPMRDYATSGAYPNMEYQREGEQDRHHRRPSPMQHHAAQGMSYYPSGAPYGNQFGQWGSHWGYPGDPQHPSPKFFHEHATGFSLVPSGHHNPPPFPPYAPPSRSQYPHVSSLPEFFRPYQHVPETKRQPEQFKNPQKTAIRASKPRKRPRRKKDKDKPKRPLSAYNFFFKDERAKMLAELESEEEPGSTPGPTQKHSDDSSALERPKKTIAFRPMAKRVGALWKDIDADRLARYEKLAVEDLERYQREIEAYRLKKKHQAPNSTSEDQKPAAKKDDSDDDVAKKDDEKDDGDDDDNDDDAAPS